MKADTYEERHEYTNTVRTRCSVCHKVVFPDEATAQARAEVISVRRPMMHYLGECAHWHLSRRRPPRNGRGRKTSKPATPNY